MNMNNRIHISILLFAIISAFTGIRANAQIVVVNPLEWAALIEGNELINAQMRSEIEGQTKTAVLQNTIAAEFTQIRKWEKKYNAYLKDADGFASAIKASSYLYNDGVMLFINLTNLKKAVESNPQGIAASLSMNNLYVETATELVAVYNTLRDAVAKGGEENMLTGAERSSILWDLNDHLEAFNHKLNQLAMSIKCYTMNDVWYSMSAGIVSRSNGEIASQARARWMRAARQF